MPKKDSDVVEEAAMAVHMGTDSIADPIRRSLHRYTSALPKLLQRLVAMAERVVRRGVGRSTHAPSLRALSWSSSYGHVGPGQSGQDWLATLASVPHLQNVLAHEASTST